MKVLLESLLAGKLPRSLRWHEVVELIGKIGRVEEHGGTDFTFVVGTQRTIFKRPHTHELDVEEVSRLRKFLHTAELNGQPGNPSTTNRIAIVIDHHAAHVYKDLGGSRPEDEVRVKPYDPYGFHHHLIHRKEAHYSGERIPEEHSFYEEVAKDIVDADEIILIGHGTGKSNAAQFLADYLDKHHSTTSAHVIAIETADLSALTELDIEAIAKKHLT